MEKLDSVQLEQLKAIGSYLAQVRQEQGRSLEDIATRTYIPLRLLKAIETGTPKPLPEPVYIQGFIRRYADILGIDGQALAQQFPIETEPEFPELTPKAGNEVPDLPPDKDLKLGQSGQRSGGSVVPYVIAGVIAAAALVFGLTQLRPSQPRSNSNSSATPSRPAASPSPVGSLSSTPTGSLSSPTANGSSPSRAIASPSTTPGVSPSASPTTSPNPGDGPVEVELNLSQDSWMRITVDGRVEFEGTLESGTQRTFSGQQNVVVRAGNAGAVTVSANGGTPEVMGNIGQIGQATFTAESTSPQ